MVKKDHLLKQINWIDENRIYLWDDLEENAKLWLDPNIPTDSLINNARNFIYKLFYSFRAELADDLAPLVDNKILFCWGGNDDKKDEIIMVSLNSEGKYVCYAKYDNGKEYALNDQLIDDLFPNELLDIMQYFKNKGLLSDR